MVKPIKNVVNQENLVHKNIINNVQSGYIKNEQKKKSDLYKSLFFKIFKVIYNINNFLVSLRNPLKKSFL